LLDERLWKAGPVETLYDRVVIEPSSSPARIERSSARRDTHTRDFGGGAQLPPARELQPEPAD
jgi:hypothetical protein